MVIVDVPHRLVPNGHRAPLSTFFSHMRVHNSFFFSPLCTLSNVHVKYLNTIENRIVWWMDRKLDKRETLYGSPMTFYSFFSFSFLSHRFLMKLEIYREREKKKKTVNVYETWWWEGQKVVAKGEWLAFLHFTPASFSHAREMDFDNSRSFSAHHSHRH